MPYTEDKRIRDLDPQITLLLTDVLAMDRSGALEATKVTMQQLVNLVSPNTTKQFVYADVVAPDNALGINGDLAFRVPLDGSALQMYQKISNVWASVFNLPLVSKNTITGDESVVDLDNEGGKLTTILDENNMFICEVTPTVGDAFKIPMNMLLGNVLFGFPRPDANTYTFKITYI